MVDALKLIDVGNRARRMFEYLARLNGRYASIDDVADHIYGDRVDGGPLDARKTIHVLVHQNRGRLAYAGLELKSQPGRASSGYALRWMEE